MYLVGNQGTVITGGVYADENGTYYVQDRLRIITGQGEKVRLVNETDGTVDWAVYVEREEDVAS